MTDETIFAAALDHNDPRERAAYLDAACGADTQQRVRVDALLAAFGKASGFLEGPAAHPEAGPAPGPTRRGGGAPEEADEPEPIDFLEPPLRPDSLGRLGHYEILQLVGRGGFGIVFRAFDDILQRVVAIKVLSPRMAATSPARKRFVREARGYAAVRHENVVAVHAIEAEPLPYIVMEFIPGETLEGLIARTGPIEVADVVRIGIQIARGLAAAHAQGIIHRDIKPANVLVENGPDRKVKLTDFGLARAADDASLTQSGMIAGTPMYMAPEQAYGTPLDHRADLFSLGSVLYTLCTGRAPFRAQTSIAVLRRVAESDPRPIRDVIPEAPPGLCDVITKLHAKKPDDRFQTATEVADALAKCLTQPAADDTELMKPAPAKPQPADSGSGKKIETDVETRDLGPVQKPATNWLLSGVLTIVIVILACLAAVYVTRPGTITTEWSKESPLPQPPFPQLPLPLPLPQLPLPQPKLPPKEVLPKLPVPPRPRQREDMAEFLTSADWEWGAPKPVLGVNTAERELDATLTSDELVIVFARGKVQQGNLYQSRRASVNDAFGPAEVLAVGAGVSEASSLSGDGLTLALTRRQGANPEDAWVSERASRDQPFGDPVRLPAEVNAPAPGLWIRNPVLSADGRALLVTTPARATQGGGDIALFVREPGGAFAHRPLPGSPINSPSFDVGCWISDDRRVLIRTRMDKGSSETWFHTRATADGAFGEGLKFDIPDLPEGAEVGRPWLSPDGMRLYFHSRSLPGGPGDLDIWVVERKRKG